MTTINENNGEPSSGNPIHLPISNNDEPGVSTQKDFTVIWNNLSYKVDTNSWLKRAKNRLVKSRQPSTSIEMDGQFSDLTNNTVNSLRPGEKMILNKICGTAKSREITAIMGPSGAGKSSLLHCLFQNRTVGTSGQILVDSKKKNKLKVCFIPQKDYLNEWLTVREDLMFVSKLKSTKINGLFDNPPDNSSTRAKEQNLTSTYVRQIGNECSTSIIDHESNAIRIAELMGLDNCLDVFIKNISGGQKKRLSIARELMSKPDILVLDEPTTGLDSLTCYKTVMVLKDLIRASPTPMAVVVTIHQPQREVFNLFDKVYFLSTTGSVIFDDNPRCAVGTIKNIAQISMPTSKYNPASFLIEIASDELQGTVISRLASHQYEKFCEKYDSSYLRQLMQSKSRFNANQNWKFCALNDHNSFDSGSAAPQISESNSFSLTEMNRSLSSSDSKNKTQAKQVELDISEDASFSSRDYYITRQLRNCLSSHSTDLFQSFRHIFILTHRSWLSVIRNPTFTKSRLTFHTILPLIMLFIFGTHMGKINACPKLDQDLSMIEMKNSIKDGQISKNFQETRLGFENISFYFLLIYGFGINIISCTATFYPLTMQMFKKETINGLYSSAPYFIGQMLAELPLELILPSISILLSYPLSGQPSSFLEWRMFAVAYVVFLTCYATHSLGLLSGSIFINNVTVAVLGGQILLFPFVMLSGFIIRFSRMSDWMYKLTYISPYRNCLVAFLAIRYGFNVCECDEEMLPAEGESIGFDGMSPNVRHVLEYMFPKNNDSTSDEVDVMSVFDKLGQRFVNAQTFSLKFKTCEDVKPYMMHVFEVENTDLFISIGALLIFIFIVKLTTFTIMKSIPYRI